MQEWKLSDVTQPVSSLPKSTECCCSSTARQLMSFGNSELFSILGPSDLGLSNKCNVFQGAEMGHDECGGT